ncbi:MAG TPA: glutathione binding-like protein [Enhygromyxa sp.]|nr:glutathione binding-like protein [Enhygromyxa sp.]
MMKIFGHPMSTCTRKVVTTLIETDTPYELELVDFAKGEHKQPANLARQPWGRVPALDDEGFAMHESRAMCRYINDKAGGNLVPADLRARAVMEQWISVEYSYFTAPTMKFVLHHLFQMKQDEAALEAAQKDLDHAASVVDAHLAKHSYFAGQEFSLADICYMPYVDYGLAVPAKETLGKYRHLMAWWTRVSERPSWLKATGRA